MTKEEAKSELSQVKDYAIKVLKLMLKIDNEDYILLQSMDESNMLESFYVERIIIIKGDNNVGRTENEHH